MAVIHRRRPRKSLAAGRWILVALDETSASDMLPQNAIDEGRLRKAPVLALRPWGNDTEWTGGDKTSEELREKLDRYLDEAERDDAEVR